MTLKNKDKFLYILEYSFTGIRLKSHKRSYLTPLLFKAGEFGLTQKGNSLIFYCGDVLPCAPVRYEKLGNDLLRKYLHPFAPGFKLARTIADLEGSEEIQSMHPAEALDPCRS